MPGRPDDPAERAPAGSPWLLALVTALCALAQLASALYLPSLPAIREAFATTDSMVQVTPSAFLVGFALAQLVYGPLSDRFGRRPVILAGVGVYVAATLACAVAPSIGFLIAARVAQGIGACAGLVVGRAVVRDLYEGESLTRAMAVITTAVAVVPGFAPLLGGVLQDTLGWRAAFGFIAAGGAAVLLLTWRALPESNPGGAPRGGLLRTYGRVFGSAAFLRYGVTTALAYGALFAWLAGSPALFIDVLGTSATAYGAFPMIIVLGYFAGGFLAGRFPRASLRGPMMMAGLGVMLVSTTLFVLLPDAALLSVANVVVLMTAFSLGLGILLPLGNTGAMERFADCAGAAAAALGLAQMTGAAAGAAAVGAASALGVLAMPVSLVGFVAAAAIWLALSTGAVALFDTAGEDRRAPARMR